MPTGTIGTVTKFDPACSSGATAGLLKVQFPAGLFCFEPGELVKAFQIGDLVTCSHQDMRTGTQGTVIAVDPIRKFPVKVRFSGYKDREFGPGRYSDLRLVPECQYTAAARIATFPKYVRDAYERGKGKATVGKTAAEKAVAESTQQADGERQLADEHYYDKAKGHESRINRIEIDPHYNVEPFGNATTRDLTDLVKKMREVVPSAQRACVWVPSRRQMMTLHRLLTCC